ncbi:hypothetical protein [Ferruginibacter sp. HRS2-29]|uniref:hypothetical protein n=1 Tax=Ferruginibacter sp. HRS2-29 TaxID=2487334 RepID=UPI0020CEB829|nr:hypothetical protein [Ferruginibacter sp. HRS2-29]MCP9753343.1 hypothetical protein [Ferruginibacter sp. HRS2-29]
MRSLPNIEIFRTDVYDRAEADMIVERLHAAFTAYLANFDLHDCDRILRIESRSGEIAAAPVIKMMEEMGYEATLIYDV